MKSAFGSQTAEEQPQNHTQVSVEALIIALAPQITYNGQGGEIGYALHDLANIIEQTIQNPAIDQSTSFREIAFALYDAVPGQTTLSIPNDIWHRFENDVEALEGIQDLLQHTIDRRTEINNASNVTVLNDVRGKRALKAWKENLAAVKVAEMPTFTTGDDTFYFPPDTVDTSSFPDFIEKSLDELHIDLEKITAFRNETPNLRARVMFDNQRNISTPYDWTHEG